MIVPKPFQILLSLIAPVPWLLTFLYIIIGSVIVLFSSRIAGLLHPQAALLAPLLLLFNNEFILATITAGSIIVLIGLVFPALYYLLTWQGGKKNIIIVSLLLLVAGLTRPEAWLLVFPVALFFITHHPAKIKANLLPLALLHAASILAVCGENT